MAVNKVVMNTPDGEETIIDLTGDTVTPQTLAEGIIAHGANGEPISGVMPTSAVLYTAQTLTEAQKEQARRNIGITASGENTIPDYWISELETKAEAIQLAMETAGRNKSAFLWYTDAHWPLSSKKSPALLKYLMANTPMNKVNFGGDIIGDPSAFTHENIKYAYEWRKMVSDISNHHSVFGNHDVNHNGGAEIRNMAYSFMIAPEESSDMVMGDGAYYYIDNNAEKTRYLYLEYMTSDHNAMMAQGAFIVDAIKSTPEEWHIVAINHRWWQYSSASAPTTGLVPNYEKEILSVFDAYNARTTTSDSNYFYAQDFTDCKGKVAFCIGGHIHIDHDFESDGGIPVIITAPDTNQERSSEDDEDSGTIGTITESAVFGIIADYTDAENTKITVVGVGRGTSRVIGGTVEPERRLLNLDRTYVSGATGETVADRLDESKAYLNVAYTGYCEFNAGSCTASDITEDSVTVKESGIGGICVAYPVHLTDIGTQAYKLTFDYSGAGKCRSYYRYVTADGYISGNNNLYINDTAGASGSVDVTIPANPGYEWLIILLSSNTGNTKTFTNVTLTKA